ncbi:hypothetical protein G15_1972 [Enterococcus avium]|uniref:FMN-binding protein n=1 Tax=Enterococcus malodoratus TaxID=71451 RepID=UPI0008D1716A|nr:FMN-binding protein [Enterococcus malodoratus]BBM18307.1 hypothetical protein G15_1972 [Enterococcus avium]SET83726.1 FMN-binding domain-containing protein [Enterococcus malodoratus]
MGKRTIIILIVVVVLVVCIKLGAGILTKRTLKKVKVNELDISKVADGEYKGFAQIKPVSAKVQVSVEKGKISTIQIKDHMTGLGKNGEKIVNRIIDKQSLEVDAISGATQSSITILKAVEDALVSGN